MKKIKNFLKKQKLLILTLTGLGIFIDIFVLKFTSDLLILFLTGLWIYNVWYFKFKGRASIGLALGFLILCSFLSISKKGLMNEKAGIWTYLFLIIGVVKNYIDLLKEERVNVQRKD